MPQPDSSRERALPESWNEPGVGWPRELAVGGSSTRLRRASRRQRGHVEDARHAADLDGNEELARQARQAAAPSSRPPPPAGVAPLHYFTDRDVSDTDEWVASRLFTLEDELEDTWPNLPPPALDE